MRQPDEGAAGHQNSRHHQPARAEPIDDPSCQEAERRSDHQLAQRVAGGDLRPGPSELRHHEVVVERQPVQGESDDGEERNEGGESDLPLRTTVRSDMHRHQQSRRVRRRIRKRNPSGCVRGRARRSRSP